MTKDQVSFKEWINAKYLEWMVSIGEKRPLYEFAKYLGITAPTLSLWVHGKRKPSLEHVNRLAVLFGPEVYAITQAFDGLDSRQKFVQENWHLINEKDREQLIEIIERRLKAESIKSPSLKTADETGA